MLALRTVVFGVCIFMFLFYIRGRTDLVNLTSIVSRVRRVFKCVFPIDNSTDIIPIG